MSAAPAPGPLVAPPPGAWAPMRRPLFRDLWVAGLASNVGTFMQNVGAAWLMTSLAPTPFWVALVQAATNLPLFLFALPAGALADVLDRRRVLLVWLVWLTASAALLGVLTLAGGVGPGALLAFTFSIGLGSAFLAPAFQAVVPELVPRQELEPAVSLNGISMNLARAAGPALGGAVVALAGTGATFLCNAASFVAVIVPLARWRRPPREGRLPPEELLGAMRAGVRYVRHSPDLQRVLWRTGSFVLPASAVWALLPLYARETLGLGATGYGVLLGVFGVGAVAAGLALTGLRRRLGIEAVSTISVLVFAASHAVLGWTRSFWAVGLALLLAGGAWLSLLSLLNAVAQLAIPSWVRARALASYLLVLFGGLAVGSAVWGALAEAVGVPRSFLLAAVAIVLGRLATVRVGLPSGVGPDVTPAPRWPDPELLRPLAHDRGPVLVTVEYEVEPADAAAFAEAMHALRPIRLRDGALRWGLWADAAAPGRFLESFVVESWLEHLRQHERMTTADREVQERALALHRGAAPPRVTHFLYEPAPRAH
jgi:MFS family permease